MSKGRHKRGGRMFEYSPTYCGTNTVALDFADSPIARFLALSNEQRRDLPNARSDNS